MGIATRGDENRVVVSWRLISIATVAVRVSTQNSSSPVVVLVRVSGGAIARLLILLAGCHCQRWDGPAQFGKGGGRTQREVAGYRASEAQSREAAIGELLPTLCV